MKEQPDTKTKTNSNNKEMKNIGMMSPTNEQHQRSIHEYYQTRTARCLDSCRIVGRKETRSKKTKTKNKENGKLIAHAHRGSYPIIRPLSYQKIRIIECTTNE